MLAAFIRHSFTASVLFSVMTCPIVGIVQQTPATSSQPIVLSKAAIGELPFNELQQRAQAGDAVAQNELAVRYRLGRDVDKNTKEALDWFQKAAFQGYGKAMFNPSGTPVRSLVEYVRDLGGGDK